ncbi:MAG: hypothetical protein GWP07_06590 [Xanthomonadaceae bacterium]|nr:hypothetical protein [Xanthomonadaceae bacterium]
MKSKHTATHSTRKNGHQPHYLFKHKIAVFGIYLVIFVSIAAWLDYYAYEVYNPLLGIMIAVVVAFIATFLHTRRGGREDEVDKLADKI